MTVKRENGEKMEVLSWGPGTKAYRLVLLGAVLAATPIGQNILNQIGIKTPVADQLDAMKLQIMDVKSDVARLKEDVATVKAQENKLDIAFTGFQIDFNKYRAIQKDLP